MSAGATVLVFVLCATLATWGVLRLFRPELELRLRTGFVVALSALSGFALAFVTLGRYKKRKPETASPATTDPKLVLIKTGERFETNDTFEELENNADDLLPPPPRGDSLDDELEDFRAGSAELLGDDRDPSS